ncbi:MAG: pyridine nucleotide-disulfide oxidoreductase [Betaproteobacteria bacterium RIFCSPLOWO2_02_FULL_67_26]|nr:MAG: pyridine nucleotide-disulfide oxidoreductase [Betaproteobacteria bacterium RIFCSPLOWO2_02_FULL_67_26]
MPDPHRIVIVGGGAGGLELATRLGDTLGRKGRAQVTLVDRSRTHLWKPLLHEFAAGSMDLDYHALSYLAQARWHYFRFQRGSMDALDRGRRVILVAPTFDEDGRELIPRREISYDTLVIAVGSNTNDFGTPGAREHAISLDMPEQAELFHRRMINACIRANAQVTPLRPEQLKVAIIGAGATGVELAAELHKTTRELVAYGLDRINPEKDIKLTIIEAAPRILPAVPERLSKAAEELLRGLDVQVLTGERVTGVAADGVTTAAGRAIPAELTVWAAGIKAPDFLKDIGGLETNRLNQLVVRETLDTTRDPDVFAMGDCASCPWPGHDRTVPPTAQAAHQQANHLSRMLPRRLAGKPLEPWRYRDFGSLVSLGEYSTVGSLMGALLGGTMFVEGLFARFMYVSLYRMHVYALHGLAKMLFDTLAKLITRRTEPRVKLH